MRTSGSDKSLVIRQSGDRRASTSSMMSNKQRVSEQLRVLAVIVLGP